MRSRFAPVIVCAAIGVAAAWNAAAAVRSASAPRPAAARPPATHRLFVDGRPDTGQYLPDSFVICRVGKRATRVADYVKNYFFSYAEFRPNPDSAGRVEFLQNLINKDLLGQVALEINRPLTFEDRATLREADQRLLSNALYRTAVLDSLNITEDDIHREYETFRYRVRVRHIVFPDLETARRVRLQLLGGRIGWDDAYNRYSLSKGRDKDPKGELGWSVRTGASLEMTRKVFSLGPGGISDPVQDTDGWNVLQIIEKQEVPPPTLSLVRSYIRDQLSEERVAARTGVMRAMVRKQIGMVYDSTQIAWAAKFFQPSQVFSRDPNGVGQVSINTILPDFSPADTGRVLARFQGGVATLGGFMHAYTDISPLLRPSVDTPENFQAQLDGFVFEPYLAQVARDRGLERDSSVVADMAVKREQLLVDHLYSDSILTHVVVDTKQRRRYYDENKPKFVTWAHVRFAALWASTRAEADSLQARLKAGEKAEDIIRADSLLGIKRGSVQDRSENDHGTPYQKMLFEEMRPGQIVIEGPDQKGEFLVLDELEFIPGHQLTYEDSEEMIDESLQNMEAERQLKAFIARHERKYQIASHPDLVMRIRLVDPSL